MKNKARTVNQPEFSVKQEVQEILVFLSSGTVHLQGMLHGGKHRYVAAKKR